MTTKFEQCEHWVEKHRDVLFDCVRIYLGAGLFVKGIDFLIHPETFAKFSGSIASSWMIGLAPAVPYVHILGGLLLALGVLTRWAALAQLAVLFVAVFYVNLPLMIDSESRQKVEFSALMLFLMTLLCLRGEGRLSVFHLHKSGAADTAGPSRPWASTHDDIFLDLIRMYLGVGLLIKGLYFMEHREDLVKLLEQSGSWVIVPVAAMHYVIPAHFAGGLLLALGLVTRIAAVVQIPILVGAVVLYLSPQQLFSIEGRQDFEFTTLVLFLMIVVTIHGGGRWSIDYLLSKKDPSELEPKPAA